MIKDNLFYLIYQMGNNVGYFDINLRSLHISCQMFDSEGDTVEDRETADYLCFVTEGNGWFKLEDAKRCDALKSGAVFRLPKDVKYSYGSKKKDPVKFYAIALDCWDSQKFFAPFGIMKSHPVKYCESKVFSLVEELYETVQLKKIENCYKSISLLYEIFSVISDRSIEPESKGDSNEYIDQALALIHARYYDDINVNMLADAFHLNRSYFSVLFKKKVGVSPHEYLLKFRIMQACKLLKMGKSVVDVAGFTGFNSAANFTVHFKRIMNITPSEYKNLTDKGERK